MTAYIAGPITGDREYKAKFGRAEKYVSGLGYDVVLNPARTLPENVPNTAALPICLRMLEAADTVFFLPGWSSSPGASIERAYARYLGKEVDYLAADC